MATKSKKGGKNPADDPDFDFEQESKGGKKNSEEDEPTGLNTRTVKDKHEDEVVEFSDHGSEYPSEEGAEHHQEDPEEAQAEEQEEEPEEEPKPKPKGKPQQIATRPQVHEAAEGDEEDADHDEDRFPGSYNPNDFDNLNVPQEVKDLFKYITRFRPENLELQTAIKPFIPDYIPSIGEVDAFLKPPRPDKNSENLGLAAIDEPCLNQSKESTMRLLFNVHRKQKIGEKIIDSVAFAEKNPKEVTRWIQDVTSIQRQPPSVGYTKAFPDIDHLMQEWPAEVEDALQNLRFPSEEIDMSLEEYSKLACSLCDIPVFNTSNNKNLIESLHVLFTLYSEFNANQHFQQQTEQYVYGNN